MNRFARRLFRSFLTIFLFLNVVAFFHAWKFTHFSPPQSPQRGEVSSPSGGGREGAYQLSLGAKIKTAFFGIENPKPKNSALPAQAFEVVKIESTETLEAWFVASPQPPPKEGEQATGTIQKQGANLPDASAPPLLGEVGRGLTVALFHGYRADKSQMLDRSDELHKMGFNTLLVDFTGSGGSEGLTTTIGFDEAEQVRDCFEFLKKRGEENIVLFGTSMGAAAVMKALHDYPEMEPTAVILECPFGTMYGAVKRRFEMLGAPPFPLAALLTFWGGAQNGFWAFSHNPVEYAKAIHHPTLLLWGEKDDRVGRAETDAIFENLPAEKSMETYPESGHENYLNDHREEWVEDVFEWLNGLNG